MTFSQTGGARPVKRIVKRVGQRLGHHVGAVPCQLAVAERLGAGDEEPVVGVDGAASTEPVLHRANAFKNTLLFTADLLPAIVFAVVGPVVWSAVWPLGAGALAGGLIGPSVARRAPQDMLRTLIGLSGLGLAGYLLVK